MLSRFLNFLEGVRLYVEIGLLTLGVAFFVLWRITSSDLSTEKEGRRADQKEYQLAQEKATQKAIQAKVEQEAKDNKRYEEAKANYNDLKSKYDASLLRYAKAQSATSRANLPSTSPTSRSSDTASESTNLPTELVISYEDAQVCAENTARLKAVHDWATQQ